MKAGIASPGKRLNFVKTMLRIAEMRQPAADKMRALKKDALEGAPGAILELVKLALS